MISLGLAITSSVSAFAAGLSLGLLLALPKRRRASVAAEAVVLPFRRNGGDR